MNFILPAVDNILKEMTVYINEWIWKGCWFTLPPKCTEENFKRTDLIPVMNETKQEFIENISDSDPPVFYIYTGNIDTPNRSYDTVGSHIQDCITGEWWERFLKTNEKAGNIVIESNGMMVQPLNVYYPEFFKSKNMKANGNIVNFDLKQIIDNFIAVYTKEHILDIVNNPQNYGKKIYIQPDMDSVKRDMKKFIDDFLKNKPWFEWTGADYSEFQSRKRGGVAPITTSKREHAENLPDKSIHELPRGTWLEYIYTGSRRLTLQDITDDYFDDVWCDAFIKLNNNHKISQAEYKRQKNALAHSKTPNDYWIASNEIEKLYYEYYPETILEILDKK
jgi:hypothetical protein